MCSAEKVKIEYNNGPEIRICQACLSSNRILSSPVEYMEMYRNICLDSYPIKHDLYFCWECIAVLKKMKRFKDNVLTAQRILSQHAVNLQHIAPKCLSKLVTTKTIGENIVICNQQDNVDTPLNIKHVEIKQEIESENETIDNENFPEEINAENPDQQENTFHNMIVEFNPKKMRRKKYRMILNTGGGRALRKIKIGVVDIHRWLERERNSNFYRNLKNKCDKCVTKLGRKERVEKHYRTHHDEAIGRYACDICQTYFSTKAAMRTHVAGHSYIRHCNVCGYECYTASHMNSHMMGHKKTVQCLDCNACYNNVRHFYTHYKAMHRVYMCDHCDKHCKTKRSLEKHMRRHLTHQCKLCNLTFKSYSTLRHHRELKHVTQCTEDAFCVPCDRQFRNALVYRRHVSTSTAHRHERRAVTIKKEKVACPECSKVYTRRSYMMNHYRHVHRHHSNYYCQDCDKYFLNRTRYLDHRRYNHEGLVKEKDKLCNICGRGFAANRTLINHMRTHSGERPYVCTYCDCKFTQKQAMLSHVKFIHLKDRRKPAPSHTAPQPAAMETVAK